MSDTIDNTLTANSDFLVALHETYKSDPTKLDPSWQQFFKEVEAERAPLQLSEAPADLRITNLIQAYRRYGHLFAAVNPIAMHPLTEPQQLSLETLGFSSADLSQKFPTLGLLSAPEASLKEIIQFLRSVYCGSVGIEYIDLDPPELVQWIQKNIEESGFKSHLSIDEKKRVLEFLNRSELFESFLHTKYVGQKRFSLEGGETLIPMLAAIIDRGSALGMKECVLGMAHRGRLNVLSNILYKSYADIFSEFDIKYISDSEGTGDVKYHKGYFSAILSSHGHKIKISLTPNPSHLEFVDPVVEGQVRAKQFHLDDEAERQAVIPVLIHGDAALTGQGIVYETLQLYNLPGYRTGGTIHLVINNQIGFTTLPKDSRSTYYCTDIAKTFNAPVFHVNTEDPEACVYIAYLAMEMRQKFHCDVFIDLNCYRKYGHNEGDEPAFTQPLDYQLIRKKKSIREIYRDSLIQQGVLEKEIGESLQSEFKDSLQKALEAKLQSPPSEASSKRSDANIDDKSLLASLETGVPLANLQEVAKRFSAIPSDFHIHPKLKNLVNERLQMVMSEKNEKLIDWGMGEFLAYATLLWEGTNIRVTGQDVCRGTFSHRHALWMDQVVEKAYYPLSHLKEGQGRFEIVNSSLSEMAALGFEYGYSLASVDSLVIWEAQFGDFSNGAQVIIDQFIVSGEQKWGQKSGLTLFLPHGYEGQGPEHSSARMERFLTLAGHNNMFIVNPTTPAQLFHLLRRQRLISVRKPLIVFTPKGLLRHPQCVNSVEDFTKGSFQEVLDDPSASSKVKRLVFCSGRIYYDLLAEREKQGHGNLAVIRIEQIYPLHLEKIKAVISKYKEFSECMWVQEEPLNMGAWNFMRPYLEELLDNKIQFTYVGRRRSASPATGSHAMHEQEHQEILDSVFSGLN